MDGIAFCLLWLYLTLFLDDHLIVLQHPMDK